MITTNFHKSYSPDNHTILLDLHTHSVLSGHNTQDSISDMIEFAAKSGIQILGISEHGPATRGSVDSSYFKTLTSAPRKYSNMDILYGVELNIINTAGDIDLEDTILSTLDYALISIHPPALTPYEHDDLTNAYINAMKHPKVKFLGHIDDARFPVNFERLLTAAKENDIYPEINNGSLKPDAYRKGGPENCHKILEICKKLDLPVLLSSDSHGKDTIGNMEYIYPLLEKCNFPFHLIINYQPKFLWKILEKGEA